MTSAPIASWSNVQRTTTQLVPWRDTEPSIVGGRERTIARGAGRSFGDAAFVTSGITLSSATLGLIGVPDFRARKVECDVGVAMVDLHQTLERGSLELPVYGGTPWATIGGALAADIHGKSDRRSGSFGNYVDAIKLVVAGGDTLVCSRDLHPDLFAATIGGMGLTGFVKSVTLRLTPKSSSTVRARGRAVASLDELLACFETEPADYHVADCIGLSSACPKGVFWSASHVAPQSLVPSSGSDVWLPRVEAFNRYSVGAIEAFLHRAAARIDVVRHVRDFNYGGGHTFLKRWNRLFGHRGFIEYHFALAADRFREGLGTLRRYAAQSNTDLFFGVIKRFGDMPRAGLLSFPMPGYGMNFQVVNTSENRRTLRRFTDALLDLGGRIYLAKDAVLFPRQLEAMYPSIERFREVTRTYDPSGAIQSDLSIRLGIKPLEQT